MTQRSEIAKAEAWRWTCPLCGVASEILGDERQTRADFEEHAGLHPASEYLQIILGDKPLLPWRRAYVLKELDVEKAGPTPTQAAQEAAGRIEGLLTVAQHGLAKKAPCSCGNAAPKFDFSGDRLQVACAGCGKRRLEVVTV